MSDRMIEVLPTVRQKATAQGAEGQAWLDRLPSLISELERDWGLSIGLTLGGGSESYVSTATTRAGDPVTIKLHMPPYASFASEARVLMAAHGREYARLITLDETRHAMLLERLGPSLSESGWQLSVQIEILCATLQRAWTVPAPSGIPTGADKARWLAELITTTWEEVGRPCSRHVIEQAHAHTENRAAAFDPDSAVLVHGDAHSSNLLQDTSDTADSRRYKLIDPDGLLAEPAYDLAILMREWSRNLLLGDPTRLGCERCAYLSRLTGVEPQGIWEWGFIERVSTGLLLAQIGAERQGEEMLAVAEAWAIP